MHDQAWELVDLAVAIADGAECISDIAVLTDQPALFGPVASDSTAPARGRQILEQDVLVRRSRSR